jgi:hypothetical protein
MASLRSVSVVVVRERSDGRMSSRVPRCEEFGANAAHVGANGV